MLESQKIAYDSAKHITTLSSATVVVLATFIKDIFKAPEWSFLVPFVFASLMVAIVANVVTMLMIFNVVKAKGSATGYTAVVGPVSAWLGFAGFLAGYGLLSAFAVRNFI